MIQRKTMKRISFGLLALPIFFLIGIFVQTQAQESQEISRAYIRIKTDRAFSTVSSHLRHDFGDRVFSIQATRSMLEQLKDNPDIEFRGYASQWQLVEVPQRPASPEKPETPSRDELLSHWTTQATCSPSTSLPWGITKVKGGQAGSGNGIKVAVVDTGVKTDHPDLINNIFACKDAQSSSIRNRCRDGNGHGTHVAGTIGANGKIKGVAPSVKIAAIKVCSDSGICWSDDVARGIRHAADLGANVINLSLGGSAITQDEKNAVAYAVGKGALVVAAAGNSGPGENTIIYPAALPEVVAVAATNSSDGIASWSSRGNNYNTTSYVVEERDVELAAPGVSVESTANNGCYTIYSGTSMATPHVAGLAAKVWQGSAAATRTYLQDRARNSYSDIGRAGDDPDAGFGLPTAP